MKPTKLLSLFLVPLCAALLVCSASAEPVKLRAADLENLSVALAELDGTARVVTSTDPATKAKSETVVRQPYEFSGKVRFAIARNLAAIKPVFEALQKTKQQIGEEVAGVGVTEIPKADPKFALFVAKWQAALAEELTLDLVRLSEADLNLEKNPIPGSVTMTLAPLINELAPALAPPATKVAGGKAVPKQ